MALSGGVRGIFPSWRLRIPLAEPRSAEDEEEEMEACWKPGKSHRKLMRNTAESRTLGVSMASGWQAAAQGAGGAGWLDSGRAGSRGGLRVRGAGSQPHTQTPALPRPLPPLGWRGERVREGREGRGAEGGRRGRVVRPEGRRGGEGPRRAVCEGDAAPLRDALGVAGRRAPSGPGAPGRGRRARPPGSEESRGIRRAGVPLALSVARSLRSARQALDPRHPPPLFWEPAARAAAPPGDSAGQAPLQATARRLRAVVPSFLPSSAPTSRPAVRSP